MPKDVSGIITLLVFILIIILLGTYVSVLAGIIVTLFACWLFNPS
jgi:hypothetical protein